MSQKLRSVGSMVALVGFAFLAVASGSKDKDGPKPADTTSTTGATTATPSVATTAAKPTSAAVVVAPEAKAFFDSLGDSKKTSAAFKKAAKPGVKDNDLTTYDFNNGVEVVSSKVDGKATCYEIHNKVPAGYHAYEVCFEGPKVSKVTYIGLK